jgi:predicted phosphoribosyltransferase
MFKNALFRDCAHAGEVLAQQLRNVASGDHGVRMPALSRGGVPVGFEIAFLVRKLGLPGRQELAMGAISRGERPERVSHYFYARIADQFDAVLHFNRTTAIEPLPHAEEEQTQHVPETCPAGV